MELLDILPNVTILVLKPLKLGLTLVLILRIKLLLEFLLELVPGVDGIRSSLDDVTLVTPPTRAISLRTKAIELTFWASSSILIAPK